VKKKNPNFFFKNAINRMPFGMPPTQPHHTPRILFFKWRNPLSKAVAKPVSHKLDPS
jgi:hypothetical protein